MTAFYVGWLLIGFNKFRRKGIYKIVILKIYFVYSCFLYFVKFIFINIVKFLVIFFIYERIKQLN